jgi:hypothetical protein
MHRWLAIATIVAVFSAPAWSQRHGGGGFAGHAPSGFRGPGFGNHGFGGGMRFGGGLGFRSGTGFGFGAGFRRPSFGPNRFGHNRFFYGYRYPSFYPYGGVYYIDPGYYADYGYPPAQSAFQGYNTSPSYVDNAAQIQQAEIDRLENEVDRLHEERENRSHPPSPPEPQSATRLVFQDKHSEEVQNYAIVGQTLWIFTELKARKIPLADLDVAATTKANEDRGVDFRLPQ